MSKKPVLLPRRRGISTNASYRIPKVYANPTISLGCPNTSPTGKQIIGISLGMRCLSAELGVLRGLRGRKNGGYKTCPFDIMVSPYKGMIECIQNDFQDFMNPEYLTIQTYSNELLIRHTKYKFIFNHESPGHSDLYLKQAWKNGKDHFVMDNYKLLIERYQARIENFRSYVNDPNVQIHFIIQRYNSPPVEIEKVLEMRYPNLDFKIAWMGTVEKDLEFKNVLRDNPGLSKDDPEITRFSQPIFSGSLSARTYRY